MTEMSRMLRLSEAETEHTIAKMMLEEVVASSRRQGGFASIAPNVRAALAPPLAVMARQLFQQLSPQHHGLMDESAFDACPMYEPLFLGLPPGQRLLVVGDILRAFADTER